MLTRILSPTCAVYRAWTEGITATTTVCGCNLTTQYRQTTIAAGQAMALAAKPILLLPQTLEAFAAYIRDAEAVRDQTLEGAFLSSDLGAQRTHQLQEGKVVAEFWAGRTPVEVPNGLIHDWIGSIFIPGATVQDTLALMQDYDNHKNIYKPEVMVSRLVSHHGDDFQIHLRLLKKKIVTVVLDTDHEVHYRRLDRSRWACRSYTTRIAEVQNAERPEERVLPPDTGYGFLWRLHSYWRMEEHSGGVYLECRAITLTRDVPTGLGWAVNPIIKTLPRESLANTLVATRQALLAKN
jgi:hypothetical protein